jgi:type II secretory pathway pseudopilin PulG
LGVLPKVRKNQYQKCSISGFTLIELLVIVSMIGILSVVASPSWMGAIARQRLNDANYQVYGAMRQAQRNATREGVFWQVSFREQDRIVQWTIHRASLNPSIANWNELDKAIQLDPETTLEESDGVRQVKFDLRGNVATPPLGRITLSLKNNSQVKRCVFVSTIIGTLRMSKEKPTSKEGKYCY